MNRRISLVTGWAGGIGTAIVQWFRKAEWSVNRLDRPCARAALRWTSVLADRAGQAFRAGQGFEVIPRRWVVERTIAWINRCRRLAKDSENLNRTALACIRLASIRLMLRRLTRYCYST